MCGGGNEEIEGFVRASERSLEFGAQLIIFSIFDDDFLVKSGEEKLFFFSPLDF